MIYTLTGKNLFALRQKLRTISDEFKAGGSESIEYFYADELDGFDQILDAVRSLSLFDDSKLVIVHNFAQNKSLLENVETILEATADSTQLVLVDQKLDKRGKAYKLLKQDTELHEFNELDDVQLQRWIQDRVNELDATITPNDARYLVQRVGAKQQQLEQEIQKLAAYDPEISKDSISQLVDATPQSKIFDMLEALFKDDSRRMWQLYTEQRNLGEEPQKIIAMLTWQLQQLTYAVHAPNKTVADLTKAGMSPYSANKTLKMAKDISKDELKQMIRELARLDKISKTTADVDATLEVYLSEVSTS